MTCTHLVTWRYCGGDGETGSIYAVDPKVIRGYVCGKWGGAYCRICKECDLVSIVP